MMWRDMTWQCSSTVRMSALCKVEMSVFLGHESDGGCWALAFRRPSLRSGRVKRRWSATRSIVTALTLVISSHSLSTSLTLRGRLRDSGKRAVVGVRRVTVLTDAIPFCFYAHLQVEEECP